MLPGVRKVKYFQMEHEKRTILVNGAVYWAKNYYISTELLLLLKTYYRAQYGVYKLTRIVRVHVREVQKHELAGITLGIVVTN